MYGVGLRDVVITILSDEAQGLEAMRVCVEKPHSCQDSEGEKKVTDITTPMRMLIEEMPGEVCVCVCEHFCSCVILLVSDCCSNMREYDSM